MKYFLIYKEYGIHCTIGKHQGKTTIGDVFDLPKNVYPIGRLDEDSEGLLLISDDKALNNAITNPKSKLQKRYLVQVEGQPTLEQLKHLENGIVIRINGKDYKTEKARVEVANTPENLPIRSKAIRYRANIPTSWAVLTIHEGKNRQVRKMFANIDFPVLRLIRIGLGNIDLTILNNEKIKEFDAKSIYDLLGLEINNFTIKLSKANMRNYNVNKKSGEKK